MKIYHLHFHCLSLIIICLLSNLDKLDAQPNDAILTKTVIVESFTGSWCGLCPAGFVTAETIRQQFSAEEVIMVGVHIADPMTIEASQQLSETYSGGGVNVFLLDRYLFPDQNFIQFNFTFDLIAEKITERLNQSATVDIQFTHHQYEEQKQYLITHLKATFYADLPKADRRFSIWVVEDSVQIDANSYHQVNFFNYEPNHPYQGAGNPIPNYIHRHVLRTSIGDAWGVPQSLPETIDSGATFYHIDTIPISTYWQPTQLSLIGLIQQYDIEPTQRTVLNATQQKVRTVFPDSLTDHTIISTTNDLIPTFQMQTYPNPSQEQITLMIQLEKKMPMKVYISNLFGETVAVLQEDKQAKQQTRLIWNHNKENIAAGMYFIIVEVEHKRRSQKIVLY